MKQGNLLNRVVMIILFAGVLLYIALYAWRAYTNPFRTVVVYNDVVETSLPVEAWVFRTEQRLDAASGLISYQINEGEKARKDQVAAIAYQSQEALSQQQQLKTVEAQIRQLDYARSDDSPSGKTLETQLQESYAQVERAASRGDFTSATSQADQHKRLVLRRETLSDAESASAIGMASLELGGKLAQLKEEVQGEYTPVLTPASGVFSITVDGYETIFRPELLKDIQVAEFKELVSQKPSLDDGAVGKVATDSLWYLAMVVNEEQRALFMQKNQISVRFSSLPEAVPMSLYSEGVVKDGRAVVVLYSRMNLAETVSLRKLSCSAVFQSDRGVRVPKEAVRVLEGDIPGVYTVTGYCAEFKPIKVLAEDKNYYIVEAAPSGPKDKRILRAGDEVIIAAAELYNGKVVR